MEAEIGEILSNHHRVRNLINLIGTNKPNNENNSDGEQLYFAPADQGVQCLQIGDLSNENTTISDINTLINLVKTHKLEGQLKILNKNRRFRTNLIQLCPTVYPKQVKLCPTIENIKQKMSDETLVVSIFSYTGYSFLAEYTHVYKSKFNKEKVFEDILVIIQRALRSCSPSLNDENCMKYSEFILRMSAWEAQLSSMVLEETNRTVFPTWKALPSTVPNETDSHHIEVYIGHNQNGELSFTLRLRDELEMKPIPSMKDSKNKQNSKELLEPDKLNSDIALESIYYREFLLTDSVIETYNQVSFIKTSTGVSKNTGFGTIPPPPPPRRNGQTEKNDIRVFLLITQKIQLDDLLLMPTSAAVVSNSNKDNEDVAIEEEDQNTEAWIGRPLVSEKEASFCSEMYGWGLDSSHSLGLGQYKGKKSAAPSSTVEEQEKEQDTDNRDMEALNEFIHGPRRIPLDRMIAIERVRSIACSSHHTLLLTHLGSVFGCGENAEGALGTGDFTSRSSMTLIDWPVSPTTTGTGNIVKIAAGSSSIGAHSMAVDSAGCLYGWGVAYAVGLGQVKAITTPTAIPIGSFRNPLNINRNALTATATGAGGEFQGEVEEDLEFIDENDYMQANDTSPTTNTAVNNEENGIHGTANERARQETTSPTKHSFTAAERKEVVDVACGGGFTVCVTKSGHVYSWGVWAHGRLGLGPVPTVERMKGPYRAYSKKIARYQLHPRRIQGVEGAVSVSCGESHTLCLLRNGCVLAWGQNSCGQLGNGPSSLGMLSDAYRPILLPHFGSIGPTLKHDYNVGRFAMRNGNEVYQSKLSQLLTNTTEKIPPSGRAVVCGAFHSVCIDQRGLVYTWGARGSPCLGHNDAAIVGDWNRRINSIFSIAATENKAMVPYELYLWCLTWSMPRCVQAMAGGPLQSSLGQEDDATSLGGGSTIGGVSASSEAHVSAKQRVVQVSAGDLCTAFLTAEGKFFLCGTGPAVPSFTPASQTLQDIDLNNNEDNDEEMDEKGDSLPTPCLVASPRCPSDSWLREICTRKASYVSTSGNRLFIVVDEEVISHSLTAPLLRTLLTGTEQTRFNKSTTGSDTDSQSQFDSVFENHGKADCMILASGKVFLCHKALLAQRSPELRDMIIMESPTDNTAGQLVQLLLPELQRDAARGLLHYLYRDVLPVWCISSTSILTSLARTGKTLRMPRLQLLCDRFMRLLRTTDHATATEQDTTPFGDLSDLPPPTLARDMSALVGDPEFADVRFIAEGRAIVAHRFILEARCAYFRNMFRFNQPQLQSTTSSHPSSGEIIDVVVPDTFVGFLRLLIFLYTGTLPDGSDGMLLEDLMAADRYVVPDMKLLCENMLTPSESNWLDLLRAAQLLNSLRLELQVMAFLRTNFSVLRDFYQSSKSESNKNNTITTNTTTTNNTNNKETNEHNMIEEEDLQYSNIADFQEEFPYILNNLLETRKLIYPLPPSHRIIQQSTENNNILLKNKNNENIPVFPIYALVVACVSFFIYQHISKIIVLGPIIPIINVSGFLVFIAMAIKFFAK